jgi:hypothetical protein
MSTCMKSGLSFWKGHIYWESLKAVNSEKYLEQKERTLFTYLFIYYLFSGAVCSSGCVELYDKMIINTEL